MFLCVRWQTTFHILPSSVPVFGGSHCAQWTVRGKKKKFRIARNRMRWASTAAWHILHISNFVTNCEFYLFKRHSTGDTKVPFCLQSCVKPLEYAIAVHEHGTEHVHHFVGKEPSGLKFNMLYLDDDGGHEISSTSVLIMTKYSSTRNVNITNKCNH